MLPHIGWNSLNYQDERYKIFDKIIAAYKVRNKIVEKCRTTHQKTISDFLKCTKLSVNDKDYWLKLAVVGW